MLLACEVCDLNHWSAMKMHEFAVWGCMLLASEAVAQVASDDCAGALAVVYQAIGSWHCDTDQMGEGYGLAFSDSTDLFGPNFPYPTSPAPCLGYATFVTAPANDVWYAFTGYCTLEFTIVAEDTCHVSAWCGSSCGQLTTRGCLTVLPGQSFFYSFDGISVDPTSDTLLLQISSATMSSSTEYQLCIMNPPDPGCLQPAEFSSSTPVTCFSYDVYATNCTAPFAADGAIEVEMQLGLPPFTISWADGHYGEFSRTDLAVGTYVYTLADINGCERTDTTVVEVEDLATTIAQWGSLSPHGTGLCPYPATCRTATEMQIYDSRGVLVANTTDQQMPHLASGIYVIRTFYTDGTFSHARSAVNSVLVTH